jgi:methylmalonyl-CoA mutase cobalamin-binding subunit
LGGLRRVCIEAQDDAADDFHAMIVERLDRVEDGQAEVLLFVDGAQGAGLGRFDAAEDGDIPKLKAMGVQGIFLPGSPMQDIIDFINARVEPRAEAV